MTWSIPAHDQIGFCARCTSAICQPGLGIDQDTMDMARHNLQVLGTEENSSEIHFLDFCWVVVGFKGESWSKT